jgi:hypothetical protein
MIAGITGPVALGDRLGVRWCAFCPKLRQRCPETNRAKQRNAHEAV